VGLRIQIARSLRIQIERERLKKPKGAATLSAAPHWITPGKNYLQGETNL
jgi:hypothetical protein